MSDARSHLIGLLLGAETDWPQAFDPENDRIKGKA